MRILLMLVCIAAGLALCFHTDNRPADAAYAPMHNRVRMAQTSYDASHTLWLLTETGGQRISLDAYLVGVLFAEMPVSFPEEALKAQAIAARTFTLKAAAGGKHDGALCANSSCCQAWLEEAALRQRYADAYPEALQAVRNAVAATDGVVAVYEGNLIDAVYFSASGGRTENSEDVWGARVAYLRSVESPETAVQTDNNRVELSKETFIDRITAERPGADLPGDSSGWISRMIYTEGGGVQSVQIGGEMFSGTELRSLFGLRSTAFSIAIEEDMVCFETSGYGHRVGMSQYGAREMALDGATYAEILQHFYSGIHLKKLI